MSDILSDLRMSPDSEVFDLANPSDAISVRAIPTDHGRKAAAVCLTMRSNGYALSNEAHKDFVTFGLFDGFLPLREVGFKDIDEVSVWVNSPENRLAVAAVMASVCYGDESDREVLCELLETIPTEAARRARLAKWDDKKRSSMNTIVDNWRKNAAAIRKAAK